MIMGDNPPNKMRKTYLLMRGQYASPDKSKEILPDTPAFLPPMKEDLPKTVWDWQSGYWIKNIR